jgi:hypothetical protein
LDDDRTTYLKIHKCNVLFDLIRGLRPALAQEIALWDSNPKDLDVIIERLEGYERYLELRNLNP